MLEAYGNFQRKDISSYNISRFQMKVNQYFESKYTNLSLLLKKNQVVLLYDVLKPIKSDTYIILTEWSGPNSYEVWEKTVTLDFTIIADNQKIFKAPLYITTIHRRRGSFLKPLFFLPYKKVRKYRMNIGIRLPTLLISVTCGEAKAKVHHVLWHKPL